MGRYCYANGLPEPAHADLVAAREEYRRVRRERESVPTPHDRDSASAEASTAVEGAGVSPRDEAYGWPHGAPPYPGVPLHSGARAPPVFTAAAGPPAADDGATAAGDGATAAAIPPPVSVGGGALSSADDGAVACTHPPPEAHGWPHCAPPYPGAPMYSGTRAPPGSAAVAVPVATGDGATAAALPPQSLVEGGAASSTGNGAVACTHPPPGACTPVRGGNRRQLPVCVSCGALNASLILTPCGHPVCQSCSSAAWATCPVAECLGQQRGLEELASSGAWCSPGNEHSPPRKRGRRSEPSGPQQWPPGGRPGPCAPPYAGPSGGTGAHPAMIPKVEPPSADHRGRSEYASPVAASSGPPWGASQGAVAYGGPHPDYGHGLPVAQVHVAPPPPPPAYGAAAVGTYGPGFAFHPHGRPPWAAGFQPNAFVPDASAFVGGQGDPELPHAPGAGNPMASEYVDTRRWCYYGSSCNDPRCRDRHPDNRVSDPRAQWYGGHGKGGWSGGGKGGRGRGHGH